MNRSLEDLGLALGYNSAEADLVSDFYVPCLEVAERYDRAVGYFRSSVYHLVGVALSDFALRGGKMRLICSPGFTSADRATLETATIEGAASVALHREIQGILEHPENLPVLQLLATLIAYASLEVRVSFRPHLAGIFHEKLGVLFSGSDVLSFSGSTNETFMAWDPSGNHEGFETFGSWDMGDARRVTRHVDYFQRLWDDEVSGLRTIELPDASRELLDKHMNDAGVEAAIEAAREHLRRIGRTRSAPRRVLQPHQTSVVENWWVGWRGIIDHVTGAGKTVSALDILRTWITADRMRCAIILVPSDLLSMQWFREVEQELEDVTPRLLMVGGAMSSPKWRDQAAAFTARSALGPRVIIATMQSASGDDFLGRVSSGEHLLIVADEVHRIGSRSLRRVLEIDAGGRLGLSATPEREHDPDGTAAIFDYFGQILEPHFGIPEAQQAGRLVPYDYFIDLVHLDEDEEHRYAELTRRIGELHGRMRVSGSEEDARRLEILRIQRARIVKKASGKTPYAISLLQDQYSEGGRWLVYCEDSDQLEQVRSGLDKVEIEALEYHTQMTGDRQATLHSFERHGGVLISIRCLDEGVDIPLVDHALILASSTNSREYIQRRGRVLRTAPGKYSANIYDILVAQFTDQGSRVLNRDLERARQFAIYARNKSTQYRLDALTPAVEDSDVQFENEEEPG